MCISIEGGAKLKGVVKVPIFAESLQPIKRLIMEWLSE